MIKSIDLTQDIIGYFYAQGDWVKQHKMICEKLEELFDKKFANNGNSFSSCFQYQEVSTNEGVKMRIKVYNKALAWLQSRTSVKTMGMNTCKIFKPAMAIRKNLVEAQRDGYSRVEISYQVPTVAAQAELFHLDFLERAECDIDIVIQAVNSCSDVGHQISMI